ncbi:conserved hypothetical protein [Xanthomonas citri pv. bilvae]|nr:conserved hypothetical protein [Xanthomonas citri pv. bilvae]
MGLENRTCSMARSSDSQFPIPGLTELVVGSSGRRRAGAGNTSDFQLTILLFQGRRDVAPAA